MDTSCLKPHLKQENTKDNKDDDEGNKLNNDEDSIFANFDRDTWEQRTFLFREEIAKRFGFVATNIGSTTNKQPHQTSSVKTLFSTDHQYIHCTGNMFLLVSYP